MSNDSEMRRPVLVLSSWGHPELPEAIAALLRVGLVPDGIFLAGKISKESQLITLDRIQGLGPLKDFWSLKIQRIPFYFVSSFNEIATIRFLRELNPELLINYGAPEILRDELLSIPSRGVIGVHPGRLPNYRGCSAVEWSIYNREPVAASCFFLDQGVDTGPIVLIKDMVIESLDCYEKVRRNMIFHCVRTLAEGVKLVLENNIFKSSLCAQLASEAKYYSVMNLEKINEIKKLLRDGTYVSLSTKRVEGNWL